MLIQHGELLLVPVAEMPEVELVEKGKEIIVGHSETGHHHVAVADGLEWYKPVGADTNDMYLKVFGSGKITHQKTYDRHDDKALTEPLYLVKAKNEYDLFADLMRKVRD